jgi:hypothetical protein
VGRPPKNNGESETPAVESSRTKRTLSDEARRRIAAAQKKRWAAYRKSQPKG